MRIDINLNISTHNNNGKHSYALKIHTHLSRAVEGVPTSEGVDESRNGQDQKGGGTQYKPHDKLDLKEKEF